MNDTYDNHNNNNHFVDNDVQHIPHIIGTLKWKDDQGGNINKFMSQVQLTRPIVVGGGGGASGLLWYTPE